MTLILRTLNYLKLETKTIEFATGAVATWAPKINMIIASIAMGMSTSFIPTMVSAYTLNDWDEVNNKFNQAIQMLLFISIPMTLGICFLSQSIWSIFYGHNVYGGYILGLNIWTGLCINIYMITSSALQGLNKFKLVYLSTITGFATNALLDVPLMVLYSKIGIPPFLGAVTASIVGYSLSIIIALVSLKKDCKLKYKDTFNTLLKLLIPNILMVLVLIGLKFVLPLNLDTRMSCVIYVAINAIVGGLVYAIVSFKMGLVTKVLGKSSTNKLLKKISFGKLSV
jgi:O-antigen/teichoic acid export membrane protein